MSEGTKAYIVSLVQVDDPESYKEYVRRSAAPVAAFGGTFIVKGGDPETLEGNFTPSRVVILAFEDGDAARAFFASPEYQEAAGFRRRGATSLLILASSTESMSPS